METAILEMGRVRRGEAFTPAEVSRWLYPNDWELFVPEVEEAMMELYRKQKVDVTCEGMLVDPHVLPLGPVRIQVKNKKKRR